MIPRNFFIQICLFRFIRKVIFHLPKETNNGDIKGKFVFNNDVHAFIKQFDIYIKTIFTQESVLNAAKCIIFSKFLGVACDLVAHGI